MSCPKPGKGFGRFISRSFLAAIFWLVASLESQAMIFVSTADSNFNTTEPTGNLAASGWQWVGNWGGYQGTPIGPHHFVSARHVGGAVGDSLFLNGVAYVTNTYFDDATSDLRIWQVNESFPSWAPLYRTSDEAGKSLVVFGRGLTRGLPVVTKVGVPGVPVGSLAGWQWGANDGRLRWGLNSISSIIDGGSYWGILLYAEFDGAGGVNEAHLALGDSSGPVFINDGSGWKLAGVAAAVDGPFNTANTGAGFNAAIFDWRGLYYDDATRGWLLVGGPLPVPSGFYATRVSARVAWIDGIVGSQPVDSGADVPLFTPEGSLALAGVFFFVGTRFLPTSGRQRTSQT